LLHGPEIRDVLKYDDVRRKGNRSASSFGATFRAKRVAPGGRRGFNWRFLRRPGGAHARYSKLETAFASSCLCRGLL